MTCRHGVIGFNLRFVYVYVLGLEKDVVVQGGKVFTSVNVSFYGTLIHVFFIVHDR